MARRRQRASTGVTRVIIRCAARRISRMGSLALPVTLIARPNTARLADRGDGDVLSALLVGAGNHVRYRTLLCFKGLAVVEGWIVTNL